MSERSSAAILREKMIASGIIKEDPKPVPRQECARTPATVQRYAIERRRVMVFDHGIGDAVQFGAVLRHITRSDWRVSLWCRRVTIPILEPWCSDIHAIEDDAPPSDAEKILLSEANATTKAAMHCRNIEKSTAVDLSYEMRLTQDDRDRARAIIGYSGSFVTVHHQGLTSRALKSLDESDLIDTVRALRKSGMKVVLIDTCDSSGLNKECDIVFDRSMALRDVRSVATVGAIASMSMLCIGIDSGPGKIFQATSPMTIIAWRQQDSGGRRLHPSRFDEPSPRVVHLLPENHALYMQGEAAESFSRYRHITYKRGSLSQSLLALVSDLGIEIDRSAHAAKAIRRQSRAMLHWHRESCRDEDVRFTESVWNANRYGLSDQLNPVNILDFGARNGAFSTKCSLLWPNARIIAVEPRDEFACVLMRNVDGIAEVLDADGVYDAAEKAGVRRFDLVRVDDDMLHKLLEVDPRSFDVAYCGYSRDEFLSTIQFSFADSEIKLLHIDSASGIKTFSVRYVE